jgi:hypothetical protein
MYMRWPLLGLLAVLLGLATTLNSHSLSSDLDPKRDPIYINESKRPRYFIVIAVDKSTVSGTDLPFAVADAENVVKLLTDAGYKPLGAQPITGMHANVEEITASLAQIRSQPEEARVVVYYSGHGADRADLLVQKK